MKVGSPGVAEIAFRLIGAYKVRSWAYCRFSCQLTPQDTLVIAPNGPYDELLLTPGLVDVHTHIFGTASVQRVDKVGTESAMPTIVDAGGSGAATIDDLVSVRCGLARARVRVLLSIEAGGITDSHPGHNSHRFDCSTNQTVC